MSDERRKRKQARHQKEEPKSSTRTLMIGAAIVVVFAGAIYLVNHKRSGPLDAFAQCLGTKQAKMYGLFWCPHCAEQKEMFDSSAQYLPYIECGIKGSHTEEPACLKANVRNFPTWVFADGTRVEGKQSLKYLSDKTGCSLQ
jgi:hypothetical protein